MGTRRRTLSIERQDRIRKIKQQISSSIKAHLIHTAYKKNLAESLTFRRDLTTRKMSQTNYVKDFQEYLADQEFMRRLDPESFPNPEEGDDILRVNEFIEKSTTDDSWELEKALLASFDTPGNIEDSWIEDNRQMEYFDRHFKPPKIVYLPANSEEYFFFKTRNSYYHEGTSESSERSKHSEERTSILHTTLERSDAFKDFKDSSRDERTISKLKRINFDMLKKREVVTTS